MAGKFLAGVYRSMNIVIVQHKTAYGKGLADATMASMNKYGKKKPSMKPTPRVKGYTALVSKLKQNNIQVLYVGGYHSEAGLMVRQMRDQGMNTVLAS